VHLVKCTYERQEDADRLLETAARAGPMWEAAVLLGLDCGLRIEEIAHLHWESVNLATGDLWIRAQPDGWTPKSAARRLEMTTRVMVSLSKLPYSREAPTRVFGPMSAAAFIRRFRHGLHVISLEAGLPDITPHGLRRTFATRVANLGTSPLQLQEVMGHRDIATTKRSYARVDQQRAASAVRRGLEPNLPTGDRPCQ
jgi:integrase